MQAFDMCHRIGQTNPVTVRVLHANVEIDDDMAELLSEKADVLQAALDSGRPAPSGDIRKELEERWAARRKK